jgi:DNA-binding response OmpR family regulator
MATILLIDDDADLVEANRLVLAARGHTVRTAGSAKEAKQGLANIQPDLIVLDIMMETDSAGIELAREIHQSWPAVPVIMLSSVHQTKKLPYRLMPDEDWLPVVRFLDKPVDPTVLAGQIDEMLRK